MGKIICYSDFRPGVSDLVDQRVLDILSKTSCRIAYIPSASDHSRRYFKKVQDHYLKIGIRNVTYFDLGDEFDPSQWSEMLKYDAWHLSGGDPFAFLEVMHKRTFKSHLLTFLNAGKLVIGVSAGAMVLTKSLGLVQEQTHRSSPSKSPRALGLLDFEFFPHFEYNPKQVGFLKKYAQSQRVKVYACDDGGGLEVSDRFVQTIGAVHEFEISPRHSAESRKSF